jgi:thiol-disulfide isomerase/thioredoxin
VNRRRLALVATGLGAAIAGALWSWRRQTGDPEAAGLPWSLVLQRPDGSDLALAMFRGRPLVLNFWATWCPPCVRELPALDRFHREQGGSGWQVVGVAADNAPAVADFLRRSPVGFPVGISGFAGIEASRSLGNAGGGLPFTVWFDRQGRVLRRNEGETSYEQLVQWSKIG